MEIGASVSSVLTCELELPLTGAVREARSPLKLAMDLRKVDQEPLEEAGTALAGSFGVSLMVADVFVVEDSSGECGELYAKGSTLRPGSTSGQEYSTICWVECAMEPRRCGCSVQ